jgi:hypothetical protein
MRNTLLATVVLGLIGFCPVAAMADRHGGYRGGSRDSGGYSRGYSRGNEGSRSHSHFDLSIGLGFIFGSPRSYCDDTPRYCPPPRTYYYDDAPVVYRAPVVYDEAPAVYCPPVYSARVYCAPVYSAPVYCTPPVVYEPAPVVVYRSYVDSGYCYPRTYTYVQTRYSYGR